MKSTRTRSILTTSSVGLANEVVKSMTKIKNVERYYIGQCTLKLTFKHKFDTSLSLFSVRSTGKGGAAHSPSTTHRASAEGRRIVTEQ